MLILFDTTGSRAAEWRVGEDFSLPQQIDASDISQICASGLELEFITDMVVGLVYPKKYTPVWWYATNAKTVASIMDGYDGLKADSTSFLERKNKIKGAKNVMSNAVDKVRSLSLG